MDPFIKTQFIQETVPERYTSFSGGMYGFGSLYYMPSNDIPDKTIYQKEEIQQIPPGELIVRRGTPGKF